MKSTKKRLMSLVCLCLLSFCVWGSESKAEELKDENPERLETVYGMDEEGNIFEIEDTPGIVEEGNDEEGAQEEAATFSVTRAVTPKVVNFNTKGNAVTNYTEYGTGASGYTNGAYGADAAYLGEEDGKVIFMLSGVVGKVAKSQVQVVDLSTVKMVSCYVVEGGSLKHRIAHKVTETSYSSLVYGPAPSYMSTGVKYYSYDGHYFYDDYAVMLADYADGIRDNSLNPNAPYYNYYQFLPMRSISNYTRAEIKALVNSKVTSSSKMRDQGEYFVGYQNTYGVNALLMTGIGANESAWGNSSICNTKNNLFGINAVDTSPSTSATTFASIKECIRQFASIYMSRRYLNPTWTYYHGGFLGNKASGINVSYASDPYWGEKAANVAWTLDKSGGNKDYGVYTIGIKNLIASKKKADNVKILNGSSTSAAGLYNTGAWTSYAVLLQKNAAEKGYYKIQSDAVLNSGNTGVNSSSGAYDFEKMYGYIPVSYVSVVHKGSDVVFKELEKESEEPDTGGIQTPEVTYTKYKTTTSVNYRDGAGTSYTKKGTLAKDTIIEVEDGYSKTANGYTWVRFKLNGNTYYVANQYIEKIITLAKPTLVSAVYSDDCVTVTWKKVTDAKGYYVYRKLSGGSWTKIGTVTSGSTVTYKDIASFASEKTYVYTVRAYNGSTLSDYNSGVSVVIPKITPYTRYITTTSVNYRNGAGTSYEKKGTLAKGTIIEVEDGYSKSANGYTWVRFRLNGKNYYVASQYLEKSEVKRISGTDRYATSIKVANEYKAKLGVSKFSAVVIASGESFADALSGSYLAGKKKAPMLLTTESKYNHLYDYLSKNLKSGGNVYILGGDKALPKTLENGLSAYNVKRLSGSTRYETNLAILKEAGISGSKLLVSYGETPFDSLSASASGQPILLVNGSLTKSQKTYLKSIPKKDIYVLGGTGVISTNLKKELKAYSTSIDRISGSDRYATSVEFAKKFFANSKAAVLVYGEKFPDGLSGAPLALGISGPVILTKPQRQNVAAAYVTGNKMTSGYVLGGSTFVTDSSVRAMFGMTNHVTIPAK